jgi:hypothetical protein
MPHLRAAPLALPATLALHHEETLQAAVLPEQVEDNAEAVAEACS